MTTDTTNRKYELTDETRIVDGRTLYRIRAMRDVRYHAVRAGDLGGFVESESNLSHKGGCWIDNDACVYEDVHISGDGFVGDGARLSGSFRISSDACVYGKPLRIED